MHSDCNLQGHGLGELGKQPMIGAADPVMVSSYGEPIHNVFPPTLNLVVCNHPLMEPKHPAIEPSLADKTEIES